jgi:GxxExxY protein
MEPTTEPLQQEGYDFMAAAFEVYNQMGSGFTEEIYQECLENELIARRISFLAQAEVTVSFKGRPLKKKLRPDLLVSGDIVVELKAVSSLLPEHAAQLLNYLKAGNKPVGYLVNFGCPDELEWKRFAWTRGTRARIRAY